MSKNRLNHTMQLQLKGTHMNKNCLNPITKFIALSLLVAGLVLLPISRPALAVGTPGTDAVGVSGANGTDGADGASADGASGGAVGEGGGIGGAGEDGTDGDSVVLQLNAAGDGGDELVAGGVGGNG